MIVESLTTIKHENGHSLNWRQVEKMEWKLEFKILLPIMMLYQTIESLSIFVIALVMANS